MVTERPNENPYIYKQMESPERLALASVERRLWRLLQGISRTRMWSTPLFAMGSFEVNLSSANHKIRPSPWLMSSILFVRHHNKKNQGPYLFDMHTIIPSDSWKENFQSDYADPGRLEVRETWVVIYSRGAGHTKRRGEPPYYIHTYILV